MLVVLPGPVHGGGFSLNFQRSKWALNGWLEWRWGKGVGSEVFHHKGFALEQWHQIVITQSATTLTLYIDGELSDQRAHVIPFKKNSSGLYLGKLVTQPDWRRASDFKVDQLTLFDAALCAREVNAHYEAGQPRRDFTLEQERQIQSLRLEIPNATSGYFLTGQAIPVLLDERSEADELLVNGVAYSLPLETPVELSYDAPGFREIALVLRAQGKVLKQMKYPVAIIPFECSSSKVGVAEMATRQPEARALGINLNRVVVDWSELEPKKEAYDWTRLDAVMKRSQKLEAEAILCFTGMPRWLPLAEGSKNLPDDLARYRKMWRLLTNRYSNLRYFEVWNATNGSSRLKGTEAERFEDYYVLLQVASEVIREELPAANILAGRIEAGNGLKVAAYLESHALGLFDIFSARKFSTEPTQFYLKDAWSAKIVEATSQPVWNTASGVRQFARSTLLPAASAPELPQVKSGWPLPTVDEWTAATWLIQDLVIQFGDRVQRIILENGPMSYLPKNNATTGLPGIQGMALAVFTGLVGDSASFQRISSTPANLFAYRFESPAGKRGLILFTAGAAQTVALEPQASEAQCFDFLGNALAIESGQVRVTARPLYILNIQNIKHTLL